MNWAGCCRRSSCFRCIFIFLGERNNSAQQGKKKTNWVGCCRRSCCFRCILILHDSFVRVYGWVCVYEWVMSLWKISWVGCCRRSCCFRCIVILYGDVPHSFEHMNASCHHVTSSLVSWHLRLHTFICACQLLCHFTRIHMCMWITADPTWGDIFECCFKAQSSKLERLFGHVSVKRDVWALSFELWKSFQKSHPTWDWLYFVMLLQHTATHYNTLQHTATHCNTLQHTATHCNTLQLTATHCNPTWDWLYLVMFHCDMTHSCAHLKYFLFYMETWLISSCHFTWRHDSFICAYAFVAYVLVGGWKKICVGCCRRNSYLSLCNSRVWMSHVTYSVTHNVAYVVTYWHSMCASCYI